uniref:Filament-like plant protein 3 n=1 Tax=Kalanchoe fedtschenkoi TaxID=63787 RepID=A0A7N0U2H6_KALFE
MDRRSWLWRRKSSEKSPGETESSGSISSHSERFSDEQVSPTQNTQSPEVTSKAILDDEVADDIKSLKEKLDSALSQIKLKEDSVKQHAKVAEEAVSGWEKAENEVLAMRQQLEAVTQKNLALEDRMGHLDGALKECVRQLRQAKEEQDQLINDAVCKKTQEWESLKSELQSEVAYHSVQHKNAKAEVTAFMERDNDLRSNLDAVFTENSNLKLQLLSLIEEMKVRNFERDYCIQAAETASKQHLESSKKLAKLEAECLRLRSLARKAALFNENRSVTASSIYVESNTDNQSDCGDKVMLLEADLCKLGILEPKEADPGCSDTSSHAFLPEIGRYKNEKTRRQNLMDTHVEIDLMDDFLEMERIVARPDPESENAFDPVGSSATQPNPVEITLKAELECMINRTAELEEKLEYLQALYTEVNNALVECQKKLQISQNKLKENEKNLENLETLNTQVNSDLVACQKQLEISQNKSKEYEEMLVELKMQVALANESKQAAEQLAKASDAQKEVTEARLVNVEAEKGAMLVTVRFLEGEIERERSLSAENLVRCQILEEELSRTKTEAESKEKALLAEYLVECKSLEDELLKTKTEAELDHATIKMAREFKVDQEKELEIAAEQFAECQKTIASLGRQLKSLATLEDFIIESEMSPRTSDEVSHSPEQSTDLSDLHSNKLYEPINDSELSISEAGHSGVIRNPRHKNNASSSNATRASDWSRSGFENLSSIGKIRR